MGHRAPEAAHNGPLGASLRPRRTTDPDVGPGTTLALPARRASTQTGSINTPGLIHPGPDRSDPPRPEPHPARPACRATESNGLPEESSLLCGPRRRPCWHLAALSSSRVAPAMRSSSLDRPAMHPPGRRWLKDDPSDRPLGRRSWWMWAAIRQDPAVLEEPMVELSATTTGPSTTPVVRLGSLAAPSRR